MKILLKKDSAFLNARAGEVKTVSDQQGRNALEANVATELLDARAPLPKLEIQGKAALSPSSGTSGGYLVPPGLEALPRMAYPQYQSFQHYLAQFSPDLPPAAEIVFPSLSTKGAAADSNLYGGLSPAWASDDNLPSLGNETDPVIQAASIKPGFVYLDAVVSNTLLQDSQLADPLRGAMASSLLELVDLATLNNPTGTSGMSGILQAGNLVTLSRAGPEPSQQMTLQA